MKLTHIYTFLCFMLVTSCQSQQTLNDFKQLLGTWKIENKQTFEAWQKISDTEFKGMGYKLVNGEKLIKETLSIKLQNDQVIYQALVPNQNNGATISFIFQSANTELLSFENPDHDFPKKIQYKLVSDSKVLVNVLGDNDEGFSYYMIKQD